MTNRKYKCPVCKYQFLADPERMHDQGNVDIVRGNTKQLGGESEYTIDLKCPNCGNEFEVKVEV